VKVLRKRPAEVVSGLTIAGSVYGFLTQVAVPQIVAGPIAAICGFGPLVVSRFVDAVRR
jgi:hypothetical protein